MIAQDFIVHKKDPWINRQCDVNAKLKIAGHAFTFAFCQAQEPVQILVPAQRQGRKAALLLGLWDYAQDLSQSSTAPTNLSTVALAKSEEWKLSRHVS